MNNTGAGTSVPSSSRRKNGTKVPAPEGYKQTKVGVIPEDWDVVRLKDILKVSQGLQIVISNRFIEPAKDRVFYITLPYLEGRKVEYIENPKQSVLCTKEDLLVVRTGSGVGKIVTGVEGAFHNNFFKIKGFDNLNISFLYYFLTASRTRYLMKTYASNGTIPDLPHGDFYSLNCILPPLQEQQKIAQILSIWDDAISKQEALIKAKEELKKGLMQKLLSGEVRFGEFGVGTSVPSNAIEKNGTEVPAPGEWEEVRLGDIAKINPKNNNLPESFVYIDLESVKNGTLLKESIINSDNAPSRAQRLLEKDDILYQTVRPYQKNNFFFKLTGNYVASTGYAQIRALESSKFLYHYLHLDTFVSKVLVRCTGTGYPAINSTDLSKIKIKLPPLKEQQKIAEVLTLADKEIDLLKNELEALKEQKRGLMQRLLSGEVRVNI